MLTIHNNYRIINLIGTIVKFTLIIIVIMIMRMITTTLVIMIMIMLARGTDRTGCMLLVPVL